MFTDEFKQLQEAAKRSGATTSKSIKGVADALKKFAKRTEEG